MQTMRVVKYDAEGSIIPQERNALTCEKAISARIFKQVRDEVAYDSVYQSMRKKWRASE